MELLIPWIRFSTRLAAAILALYRNQCRQRQGRFLQKRAHACHLYLCIETSIGCASAATVPQRMVRTSSRGYGRMDIVLSMMLVSSIGSASIAITEGSTIASRSLRVTYTCSCRNKRLVRLGTTLRQDIKLSRRASQHD